MAQPTFPWSVDQQGTLNAIDLHINPSWNLQIFYQWGFLKDKVYENNTQPIAELKTAFNQKIRAIPKNECVRVSDNFARRI